MCFRIEEVDDRHEGGVEDCPDDIELPSQLLNSNGRDLYDHEIEYPICCCAISGTFGAYGERVDLSWIQPRNSLPSDAEENVVQEEECNGSGCHLFLVLVALELRVANEDGDEDVAECLACCCVHHEVSATPTFDVRNGD